MPALTPTRRDHIMAGAALASARPAGTRAHSGPRRAARRDGKHLDGASASIIGGGLHRGSDDLRLHLRFNRAVLRPGSGGDADCDRSDRRLFAAVLDRRTRSGVSRLAGRQRTAWAGGAFGGQACGDPGFSGERNNPGIAAGRLSAHFVQPRRLLEDERVRPALCRVRQPSMARPRQRAGFPRLGLALLFRTAGEDIVNRPSTLYPVFAWGHADCEYAT